MYRSLTSLNRLILISQRTRRITLSKSLRFISAVSSAVSKTYIFRLRFLIALNGQIEEAIYDLMKHLNIFVNI